MKANTAALHRAERNTLRLITMSDENRDELRRTREVLMKGIFEATGVRAPICIVSCDVVGAPPSPSPHPALFR